MPKDCIVPDAANNVVEVVEVPVIMIAKGTLAGTGEMYGDVSGLSFDEMREIGRVLSRMHPKGSFRREMGDDAGYLQYVKICIERDREKRCKPGPSLGRAHVILSFSVIGQLRREEG